MLFVRLTCFLIKDHLLTYSTWMHYEGRWQWTLWRGALEWITAKWQMLLSRAPCLSHLHTLCCNPQQQLYLSREIRIFPVRTSLAEFSWWCAESGSDKTKQLQETFLLLQHLFYFITGPPTHGVGVQTSNGRWRLLSSVVICNTPRRACRRLHLTSCRLQSNYSSTPSTVTLQGGPVVLGLHFVLFYFILRVRMALVMADDNVNNTSYFQCVRITLQDVWVRLKKQRLTFECPVAASQCQKRSCLQ